VTDFFRFLRDIGLVSSWDSLPNPFVATACNARTFLQVERARAATRPAHDEAAYGAAPARRRAPPVSWSRPRPLPS
jgi:hypothetical protein